MKRVHFLSVDRPRIDVECSGKILSSSIIQNAKKNPNFPHMQKFFDLELPIEENYAPPITIRCVDCRSFGRYTLVGTHQITSIHKYIHRPIAKEDVKSYTTQGGQIILAAKVQTTQNGVDDRINASKSSPCNYITQYGAVSVSSKRFQYTFINFPPSLLYVASINQNVSFIIFFFSEHHEKAIDGNH